MTKVGGIIVLVTCSPVEADKIASTLISEKLAACVNVFPAVISVYRWKGEVCKEAECLLLIKSHKAFWERLEQRIKAIHSYEVPEMLCFQIDDGHAPYLDWLNAQLEGPFH